MFYKRKYLFLCFSLLLNLLFFTSKGQNHNAVINKLSEGLGNEESLKEARFIMFSCTSENHNETQGEHTYLYDWNTKKCRFEGKTEKGESLVALFNTRSNLGEVYINKKKTNSPDLLNSIIQLFSEDSYFLFTPILIANQNIKSTVQESEIIDSKRYFVVRVDSPGAEFEYSRIYIDSQNGTISKWETFDNNNKKTHEFVISKIKDVGGGLTLATKFTDKLGGSILQYPIVAALINIEAEKFKIP